VHEDVHVEPRVLKGQRPSDSKATTWPSALSEAFWLPSSTPVAVPSVATLARTVSRSAGRTRSCPGPSDPLTATTELISVDLAGAAAPVPPLAAAGAPQAPHRRGRGGSLGRAARLTCMPPTVGRSLIGATAPAATGPVGAPPRQARSPRPSGHATAARRIESGATACAPPTCGLDPRTSGGVRRSTPLRRGPGQPRPARLGSDAPAEHQEPLTGGSPLDGAVPSQKVERVGHGFRSFTNYRLRLHCGVRWRTHRPPRVRGRSSHLAASGCCCA
jgi:hypothetical protein